MKVHLAGYNVDTSVLREMEQVSGKRSDLTPEVLSAAYARISRDPRSIEEIRKDARREVDESRKSNSTIIFRMGHHSVAEHAVFNLDITGVSRFAMEEVEKFRLCSYTEKSQRYITLEKGFVVPEEIRGTSLEKMFTDMAARQNEAYSKMLAKLKDHVFRKYSDLASDPKKHNLLEGWAKEDARYITSLATESQVGETINARNLELLLRRFASSGIAEVRKLGRMLYDEVSEVAPSIVIFHKENARDLRTYPELKELALDIVRACKKEDGQTSSVHAADVELVEFTPDGDTVIASALLHTSSGLPYNNCRSIIEGLPDGGKKDIFKAAWRNMQFYDSMLREFEYANLTFDVSVSAACFGQLKRHRMTTITAQPYDPALDVVVPEAVKEVGLEGYFMDIISDTNSAYDAIRREVPVAAPYILTNAHKRRVLIRVNARELYHISRLREDAHSQWDIRAISRRMSDEARRVMPMTMEFSGGKDRYNEIYKSIFGRMPEVVEAVLPGVRKIKRVTSNQ